MQHYEITVLVRADEDLAAVSTLITTVGATITSEQSLGRKKLAYPIAKETSAVYGVYTFNAGAQMIAELNKKLLAADQVLRHLVIAGGIRAPKIVAKKLTEKDLEVPESLTKGMAEIAEAERAEAAKPEATKIEETEVKAEVVAEEPVVEAKPKKVSKKTAPKGVDAEELTSEERQQKLDEKLKSILGE